MREYKLAEEVGAAIYCVRVQLVQVFTVDVNDLDLERTS